MCEEKRLKTKGRKVVLKKVLVLALIFQFLLFLPLFCPLLLLFFLSSFSQPYKVFFVSPDRPKYWDTFLAEILAPFFIVAASLP